MCKVLDVSRSGFYKWSTAPESKSTSKKALICDRIEFHFEDNRGVYGSPKLTAKLHAEGISVSDKTVRKYMKELGISSKVSKPFKPQTTDSNHDLAIAPNVLNQQFHVSQPNQVWVADITYIPCREGRLYLASVMDLCTREIVGWCLYDHMTVDLTLDALLKAIANRNPVAGLIHHSDRGGQYAALEYKQELIQAGMIQSMSRRGNCYDNASMESFHSILKKELIYLTKFKTKDQAYTEIFRYIEFFYNRKRIHGSIGYRTPNEFFSLFECQHTA